VAGEDTEKDTVPRRGVRELTMGLDVALGAMILIAAIRGWLQGFVYQAIRIAGVVACVYLAAPVRDQAKPYVLPYLSTVRPELLDRLLWWVSAAVSYAVVVGMATLAIKMTRRPEIPGIPQSSRNDQSAGFLLGAAKGALVAAFLTAGIQKHAMTQIATIPWADQQVKASMALQWNDQYQPASKIWSSPPVRELVNHVQRMGLQGPSEINAGADEKPGGPPVAQSEGGPDVKVAQASRTRVDVARPAAKSGIDPEVDKAVEEIRGALNAAAKPSN